MGHLLSCISAHHQHLVGNWLHCFLLYLSIQIGATAVTLPQLPVPPLEAVRTAQKDADYRDWLQSVVGGALLSLAGEAA